MPSTKKFFSIIKHKRGGRGGSNKNKNHYNQVESTVGSFSECKGGITSYPSYLLPPSPSIQQEQTKHENVNSLRSTSETSPTCITQFYLGAEHGHHHKTDYHKSNSDHSATLITSKLKKENTKKSVQSQSSQKSSDKEEDKKWLNFTAFTDENSQAFLHQVPVDSSNTLTIPLVEFSLGPSTNNYLSLLLPQQSHSSKNKEKENDAGSIADDEANVVDILSELAVYEKNSNNTLSSDSDDDDLLNQSLSSHNNISSERRLKQSLADWGVGDITEEKVKSIKSCDTVKQSGGTAAGSTGTKRQAAESDEITESTAFTGDESTVDCGLLDSSTITKGKMVVASSHISGFDGNSDSRYVVMNGQLKRLHSIALSNAKAKKYKDATGLYHSLIQEHVKYYGELHPLIGIIYHNLGVLYLHSGNISTSLKYHIKAVKLRKNLLSELNDNKNIMNGQVVEYISETRDVINSLTELGTVQYAMSYFSESLISLREALQLNLKVDGYDHPHIAKLLNLIGCVHFEKENIMLAQTTFEEALDLQRGMIGEISSFEGVGNSLLNSAATLGNVAMCFWKQEEWDDVVSTLEEMMMVQESVLAEDHHLIKNTKGNLIIALNIRDFKQCSKEYGVKKDILMGIYGSKSDDTPDSGIKPLNLFGEGDGIPTRSPKSTTHSNHIDFVSLGPLKSEISSSERVSNLVDEQFNLSSFMLDHSSTIQIQNRKRRSKMKGIPIDTDNLKVMDAELHLEKVHEQVMEYLIHGEFYEAHNLFYYVLKSHMEKYGEHHHLTGTAMHNIGIVHMISHDYEQALPTLREAVRIRCLALTPDHPDVSVSLMKAGLVLFACAEYDNALVTFCEALRIRRKNLGYSHVLVSQILNNIGAIHYELGGLLPALKAFEEALEVQRKDMSNDLTKVSSILMTAATLSNIGFIYVKRKEYGDGIIALEESLSLYRQISNDEDTRVKVVIENLAYAMAYANHGSSVSRNKLDEIMSTYMEMIR